VKNKRLYNINGAEMGIDFDNVLCFYHKQTAVYPIGLSYNLYIMIGGKCGEPNIIELLEHFIEDNFVLGRKEKFKINKEIDGLYQDLIEYWKEQI